MLKASLIAVHVGEKSLEKEQQLQHLLKDVPPLQKELKTIFKQGKPVDVILESCIVENVDLLILGALQKENIYKYYVGSIARKLTRKASCSVLLMIKPSVEPIPVNHIVVNGLKDKKTAETIRFAFDFAKRIDTKRITIVEEVSQAALAVKVNDDETLQKATLKKEELKKQEDIRVKGILKTIETGNINVKTQSIFGRRGYSIGHYARVKRADLLIMNEPSKTTILDRIFPHDIEYILSELPTDVLIVK